MKKKRMRRTAVLALFVAILGVFPGCGRETEVVSENSVTFCDALGREVRAPKQPQRVAALLGSFADVWVLSGGSVCGTVEDGWSDFGLSLPDAVHLGGAHSPSLELLLSSEPELVIASASTASHVEMKDTLEAAGIPVAYFDVDNFEDYLEMLDICTDITGRKDLYQEHGLAVQQQIEAVKGDFAGLPEEKRKVLLLRAHSGSVKAKGSQGTVLGEMLADLGCVNIADSDESLLEDLSVESIIRQEPYRIFVVTMGDDEEKALNHLSQMMEQNPAWATLEAVKAGRVHVMEQSLFHKKPNARWAESYEKLSEILLGQ